MKFSIITPVYNGEKYIKETIESVLSQKGDFEIEYIIIDGGSSDKTVTIIKEYEENLKNKNYSIKCNKVSFKWTSEKDNGMYDAINKGFKIATGDIFAWINHDDKYESNSFEIVSKTFQKFPKIKWLTGITSYINSNGKLTHSGLCLIYNQKWLSMGIYGRNSYFIHQESVFWKKDLWDKIEKIPTKYNLAGDYWLWVNFAKYEKLWTIKSKLGFFRDREGQLSKNMGEYIKEQKIISKEKGFLNFKIKLYFWLKYKLKNKSLDKIFKVLYKVLFQNINKDYIELDSSGKPIIKKTNFYIC